MSERLMYIKHVMDVQKRSAAVVLRRSDVNWAVGEIERLEKENEKYIALLNRSTGLTDTALHQLILNDEVKSRD